MSRLFPFRSPASSDADEPRLVDISEDAADDVFAALSSGTARAAYTALHDDPRTASDLAEVTDTTVQNVRYHLDNLRDAGLVEVVDTWYSERGREMKVYAPTDTSLVVFAGDDENRSTVRTVLRELVGGVGALAVGAVAVQRFAEEGTLSPTFGGAPAGNVTETSTTTTDGGAVAATTAQTTDGVTTMTQTTAEATGTQVSYTQTTTEAVTHATQTAEPTTVASTADTVTGTATTTAEAAAASPDVLAPGLVFFAGGLVVLLAVLAYRHAR
ncbi:transcriptional regulator [Salarchaeum sp. JOR-1]|uniref:ArsR/SmtB family transcription factor n=1 Tax=Salarchaeum sp. JOR-1 TaxID=2599399 RepID=UPI0011989AD0|nr:winged helix-turn-helix domain-containing protein [Salarchaeum sp. JOR-1]QDX40332.1 winged helix-turn-helix transcriptional regulator [Salarchaeum sp. JOR-1]